jgi:DNA transformation protein and related proteins
MPDAGLLALRNLGPVSVRWLESAGITSVEELRRVGAAAAYGRVSLREGRAVSLNFLYSLYAALEDIGWDEVPERAKARLRREAGLE